MDISKINKPLAISHYSDKELTNLSEDIRSFIISTITQTGGHLASNLGMVEISVATQHIFGCEDSIVIFDTGHQCYTYKILTGRAHLFSKLRQKNGISGFPDTKESKYDKWNTGHSGTGISAGIGFAIDANSRNINKTIIVNIGDAAIFNGPSMEALNSELLQKNKVIILLNDNGRSISESVGSFSKTISKLKISKLLNYFYKIRSKIENGNNHFLKLFKIISKILDYFQRKIIANYFISLGINYIGIIDGHNIKELKKALNHSRNMEKSVLIHIKTVKGMGLDAKLLENPDQSHSYYNNKNNENSFSDVISKYIDEKCHANKSIYILTPAMAIGSKLLNIKNKYPNNFIDTGISEEHTILTASALSQMGNIVFVFIYSTFLQRTYDQLIHDVGITKNKIILCIDRAGFQTDGITHQGVFDIGLINSIPGIDIVAPNNKINTVLLLNYCLLSKNSIAIRYPKGICEDVKSHKGTQKIISNPIWIDQFNNILDKKTKFILVSHGKYFNIINNYIIQNKIKNICLINALFIKPYDKKMAEKIISTNLDIKFVEETTRNSSLFYIFCADNINIKNKVSFIGYENDYHGFPHETEVLISKIFP